jgi:catechol 2,3-dioxygenase-like lactoylglutathione lyase family enzyme
MSSRAHAGPYRMSTIRDVAPGGLRTCSVNAAIPVSDMAAARGFYEGRLGLGPGTELPHGARVYACGDQTALVIYPCPASAGQAHAIVAGWNVDDVEQMVDRLSADGVVFEHSDEPDARTDAKGIHTSEGGLRSAFFRDTDGNSFAVIGR